LEILSGNLTLLWKITIYSGFTHWKWWFSIVMLVYQRVNQHFPMVFLWFSYGNPPLVFFLQTLEFNPPVKRTDLWVVSALGGQTAPGAGAGAASYVVNGLNTPYVFHVIYPSVFI
jgi:hypothetical protein